MRKAVFPGTFDPFTIGHQSIVSRTLSFVDELIIAIGINNMKNGYFPLDKRIESIRQLYKNQTNIKVETYDSLTVDFVNKVNAHFIIRGIRTIIDFEYEKNIANINKKLTGIDTFFLFTEPEYAHISSSMVRELLHYKKDISGFIPEEIKLLLNK